MQGGAHIPMGGAPSVALRVLLPSPSDVVQEGSTENGLWRWKTYCLAGLSLILDPGWGSQGQKFTAS
jgi:hypothetical protein